MRRGRLLIAFLCAAASIAAALVLRCVLAAHPRYSHTLLTTPTGEPIIPFSINDHGQVVGLARSKTGEFRIFLWDKNNGARDLGSFDQPSHCEPLKINNAGRITAALRDPNGDFRAFAWDPPEDKKILPALPGKSSLPLALNNHGHAVGFSYASDGFPHAVLWNGDARITDLGTLGGSASIAGSINDSGQIAGFSQVASGQWHAFFWDPNTGIKDLGPTSLTTHPPPDYIHLNNSGFVVGRFGSGNDPMLISTWSRAEGFRPMPPMKGLDAHPISLNDANQFVLQVRAAMTVAGHLFFGHAEAYLWDSNEGFVPFKKSLGRRDIRMFLPRDINNKGEIVGRVVQKKSNEPASVFLEPIE